MGALDGSGVGLGVLDGWVEDEGTGDGCFEGKAEGSADGRGAGLEDGSSLGVMVGDKDTEGAVVGLGLGLAAVSIDQVTREASHAPATNSKALRKSKLMLNCFA